MRKALGSNPSGSISSSSCCSSREKGRLSFSGQAATRNSRRRRREPGGRRMPSQGSTTARIGTFRGATSCLMIWRQDPRGRRRSSMDRLVSNMAATASRPFSLPYRAGLAQLVARRSHNPKVVSSILTPRVMISSIATCRESRLMRPFEVPGRRAPLRPPPACPDATMVRSGEASSCANMLPRSRRPRRNVLVSELSVLRKFKKTPWRAGGRGTFLYRHSAQDLQKLPNSCSLKVRLPTSSRRLVSTRPLILPRHS